jgi:acyl dehydratase
MAGRPRLEDVHIGDELPAVERIVRREEIGDYAEASGDRNPLHLDDDAARAAGFPGVIAHGMFTMGLVASAVTAWVGDAGALRRMKVAFRAPVRPGDMIIVSGRVRAIDEPTRRAELEVSAVISRDGATDDAIRRGEAEVQLA